MFWVDYMPTKAQDHKKIYESRGGVVFRWKYDIMKYVNKFSFSQNMSWEYCEKKPVNLASLVFPIAWKKGFEGKRFCVKRCLVQICNVPGGINPIKHEVPGAFCKYNSVQFCIIPLFVHFCTFPRTRDGVDNGSECAPLGHQHQLENEFKEDKKVGLELKR